MQRVITDLEVMRWFRNGVGLAESFRSSAKSLVSALHDRFDHSANKNSGIVFRPVDEDRVVCYVDTPFAKGRIVLSALFLDDKVVGVLNVERQRFDREDVVYWESAYRIILPLNDSPYIEQADEVYQVQHKDQFDDDAAMSVQVAAVSIAAALIKDSSH